MISELGHTDNQEVSSGDPEVPTPTEEVENLIDKSSLGTPGAKGLRARTPPLIVDEILTKAAHISIKGDDGGTKDTQNK